MFKTVVADPVGLGSTPARVNGEKPEKAEDEPPVIASNAHILGNPL